MSATPTKIKPMPANNSTRSPVYSQGVLVDLPLTPKPFLRWAGGKRKLAPIIEELFPINFNSSENFFYEPFVGGGALNFYLANGNIKNFVAGSNLVINDINPDLIITYKVVKNSVEELIDVLERLSKDLSKKAFEKIKTYRPKTDVNRAARFIYLNKTCFNGLWRVNSKGEFNVPWGKLKNPKIFDANELRLASMRLKGARIRNVNYTTAVQDASRGDLVYFDPPYIPLSSSSSFSKYAKDDFGKMDHYALSGAIKGLTSKGVHVILSNSDTPQTREIFGSILDLRQIKVQRSISASASSRVIVKEILGVNFPVAKQSNLSNLKVG